MWTMRGIGVLACTVGASVGLTCCLAFDEAHPMSMVGEQAIIVWDAERKREHFVRQASFEGFAEDFGFIVPAPTKPEVAEADEEAFDALASLIVPDRGIGCSVGEATDAAMAPSGSVEVIEQYMVGDFEVSVLKGTDGTAILGWLEENGYTNRPAMEDWLDHYAKQDWFFAALKFVRAEDQTNPETTAVRVSFDTDVPFYPYKMPSDTWPEGHYRPISLYFVSNGVARGKYRGGGSAWEADIQWSGAVPRQTAERLASLVSLEAMDIPENATLTVFRNTANALGYDNDVYFLTYMSILPSWVLWIVIVGMVVGFIYAWRARKRAMARTIE